jgi:cobalamin biosynthesis protein CobT
MNYRLTPDVLSIAATATSSTNRLIRVESGPPMTDGKTVYLPGIKPDLNSAEARLLRGYFDHETAHIRYNSFDGVKLLREKMEGRVYVEKLANQRHTMFNAIEDVRIEAKSMSELPGTVGTIKAINDSCLAKNTGEGLTSFAQACHAVIWYGQGVSRDRASYCPHGWAILDRIDLTEYDKFLGTLSKRPKFLGAKAAAELAILLTDLVVDAISELEAEDVEPPSEVGDTGDGDEDSGDEDDGGGDSGDDGESRADSGEVDGDGDSGDTDTDGDDDGDGDSGDTGDSDGDTGGTPGGGRSSWSDEPGDPNEASKVAAIGDMIERADDDDDPWGDAVQKSQRAHRPSPGSYVSYNQIHPGAMRIAGTLRDQLMSRDRVHWSLPRESGHRIDRRTLPGVASGQTVSAFNRRRVDRAVKTKVTILMDESWSMHVRMVDTKLAAWMIADATETLGCPTQIIGFSDHCTDIKSPGRVTPAMNLSGLEQGGTELLPALIRERVTAESHSDHRRVVFVLSDGGTFAEDECVEYITRQRASGVTYFAVCIDMKRLKVHDACDAVVECSRHDVAGSMHRALLSL